METFISNLLALLTIPVTILSVKYVLYYSRKNNIEPDIPIITLHQSNGYIHVYVKSGDKDKFYGSWQIQGLNQSLQQEEKVVYRSSIWHVLGLMPTKDKTKIEQAYRKMAMVYHPDHGGSSEAFNILQDARKKALARC